MDLNLRNHPRRAYGLGAAVRRPLGLFLLGAIGAGAAWAAVEEGGVGTTSAARYRGDRQAAFTLSFDDSIPSQADFVIPHLNARGLRGTFYINPGTERYHLRERTWMVVCPLWDQEEANHTMHHRGATGLEDARAEIGGVSELIWRLYPDKSRLIPFKSGGGTHWSLTEDEVRQLKAAYHYFNLGDLGIKIDDSIDDSGYDPMPAKEEIFSRMDRVIAEKGYATIAHHGVGPIGLSEWIPTNGDLFDAILDRLAAEDAVVWTGPAGEVQRYLKERDDLAVRVAGREAGKVTLELSTPHLDAALFIEPLTLLTQVPADWKFAAVSQGGRILEYRRVETRGGRPVVMYDAAPNRGPVVLECVDREGEVASARPDLAGIRKLVACPLLEGLAPSSLIDLEGDLRGYVYQGTGRAVAALWYHGPNAGAQATLHNYSAQGIQYYLQSDNRRIDIRMIDPSEVEILDGSGRPLAAQRRRCCVSLALGPKPIYLVAKTSRQLENLILYGFLPEAPHY